MQEKDRKTDTCKSIKTKTICYPWTIVERNTEEQITLKGKRLMFEKKKEEEVRV